MMQKHGMKKVFDVNELTEYKTIREKLALAQSSLAKTPYGRGGVLRAEAHGDKVKFVLTATGEIFDKADDAFNAAMGLNVTEVVSFGKRLPVPGTIGAAAQRYTNKYGAFASILDNIHRQLGGLSASQKATLTRNGIDVDALGALQLDIVTMGSEKGGAKSLATRLNELEKSGKLHGITMLNDEGARVISFRYNEKTLNTYQANLLMAVAGHDLTDRASMLDALAAGNADKVASMFEKSEKRMRAYVSARDMSLADNELTELVRKFSKGKFTNLTDITFFDDPQFATLMKFALGDKGFQDALGVDQAFYYRNLQADNMIQEIVGRLGTKFSTKELDAFKESIKRFDKSGVKKGKWASDELKDFLMKDYAGKSKNRASLIENIYKSIEQSYDGSDPMNRRFLRSYEAMLQNKISDIDSKMSSLTGEAAHEAKIAKMEMKSLLDRIRRGELGQITGRGRIETPVGTRNIKNAFDAAEDFIGRMSKYGLVINKFSLKKETNMAGDIQSLILSGIGNPKELVYADPVAAAFHPEVFADKQTLAAIDARTTNILQEYRATIESGVIPDKIRKILERQAGEDISLLPSAARSSAMRNREFAQAVLDMMNAGMNPRDTPAMMSMLHNSFAIQAFRQKGEFMQPVLPDTFRFAVDVEKAGSPTSRKPKLTPRSQDKFGGINIGGKTFAQDADILKFRVEGHKILLPSYAPGTYFNSLGGFDLDDKGLPKLLTYTDNQNRSRLGFYLFRQPSGPEEMIFAQAQLDHQTIKSLFDNTSFRENLDALIGEKGTGTTKLELLRSVLDENSSIEELTRKQRNIEKGIASKEKKITNLGPGGLSSKDGKQLADLDYEINKLKKQLSSTKTRIAQLQRFESQGQIGMEQAILDVYENAQKRGKTSLYRLTEKAAQRIDQFGSSSLRLEDLVDFAGNAINPKFTRQGIYKALFDDGAFDMSKDILDTLDQFNINKNLRKKIEGIYSGSADSGTKFSEILKVIATDSASEEEASALMSTAKDVMQRARVAQSEGILGVYVNRSMIAGSTLNQFEDFLEEISPTAKKFMLDKYGVGMLAQETAIDLAVNFSRSKILHAETAKMIAEQYGSLDEKVVGQSLAKMFGLGTDKPVTLENIGELMMENLGRRTGFARAISGGIVNEELLLGIDEFLLTEKATAGDRMNILQSIVSGMEDAKKFMAGANTGDILRDTLDEELQSFKRALNKGNDDAIKEVLLKTFALGAERQYSSLSKLNAMAKNYEQFFETVRRSYTARIATDPVLSTASVTAEERAAANYILDQNKKNLDAVFGLAFKDRKELIDSQLYELEGLTLQTGQRFMRQFQAATKMENISVKGLVTAFDKIAAETGSKIDIAALRVAFDAAGVPLEENFEKLMEQINAARRLRRIEFLGKFDTGNAQTLRGLIETTVGKIDSNSVKEKAAQILENGSFNDELQENILKALAGESAGIEDDLARQQAQLEASILEGMLTKEELEGQGLIDELLETGKATELTDEMRDLGVGDDLIDSIQKSLTDDAEELTNRAKYKRLTKKVIKEDLGDLIKNPMVRKGAIGLGALIVGSFAYTAYKDRTVDDVAGPPMLPGGSAYEGDYPARSPEIGDFAGQGYQPGVSYKVNLYGDQGAINDFRSAAGGLVNGNIGTTMYNRIPDVNRDQYSSMASMY